MTTLKKAEQQAADILSKASSVTDAAAFEFIKPPQKEFGDLSFAAFSLAKEKKTNPAALAKEIAAACVPAGIIAKVTAVGPYVNFFFDKKAFSTAVLEEVFGRAGEFGQAPAKDERIMIEYGSPNTHKEIHVGHLRNFCLGLSVVKLARKAGYDVVPVSYIGDIGAHVAKCLWALRKFHANEKPPENRGKYLGQVYAEATRLVEENEAYKEEVAETQRKLEARDPEWHKLWEETRQWSVEELDAIFGGLGCAFDRTYFESEVEEPGKALVADLLKKGIAQKGEGGAIIIDYEAEKLGVFLLLKSDGSALYSTKELALARMKFEEFPGIGKSIHVVDARQSLYFKQLFATLARMGFDKKMEHLGYEFVTLKEGAMSSRKGNIIAYEDFRDRMIAMVKEETKKKREDWDDAKIGRIAPMIAEAAMKFGMLKQDTERPIVFDMEESMSFDGFTGPYIQYSHARLSSILAKAAGETVSVCKASDDAKEYDFLRLIADLPQIIVIAAESRRPSLLAQYLFDLAQSANDFYRDVPVLSTEGAERCRRLAIVKAGQTALAAGLDLLGITAPEEM
jgi:arginyl-tRNA synthetase